MKPLPSSCHVEDTPPRKRIVIAGEAFSANLGDPLLCEALSSIVGKLDTSAELLTLDISGRQPTDANADGAAARSPLRRSIQTMLPNGTIEDIAWLKRRRTLKRIYEEALREADALLIAGGQLFMDNQLYFPRRLKLLLDVASAFGVPVAFWACGAYRNWTRKAVQLMKRALQESNLLMLGVRDSESATHIMELFGVHAEVNADPALLAFFMKETGVSPAHIHAPRRVGVNVMDPAKAASARRCAPAQIHREYLSLLTRLRCEVIVFNNGERVDHSYQSMLSRSVPPEKGRRIEWAPRFRRAEDLATVIRSVDSLYCSRLHAGIVGWALGKNVWMLSGDSKTTGLMETVGISFRTTPGERNPTAPAFIHTVVDTTSARILVRDSVERLRELLGRIKPIERRLVTRAPEGADRSDKE